MISCLQAVCEQFARLYRGEAWVSPRRGASALREVKMRGSLEERLKAVFANVNEWLKFAEAKNAAVVTVDGAAAIAVLSVLGGQPRLPVWTLVYLYEFIVLSLCGLAWALLSFLPQTDIAQPHMHRSVDPDDNLLFYAHIAKYNAHQYLDALARASGSAAAVFTRLEEHYAHQVTANARITVAKYRHFRAALFLTLSAVVTPLIGMCVYALYAVRQRK